MWSDSSAGQGAIGRTSFLCIVKACSRKTSHFFVHGSHDRRPSSLTVAHPRRTIVFELALEPDADG